VQGEGAGWGRAKGVSNCLRISASSLLIEIISAVKMTRGSTSAEGSTGTLDYPALMRNVNGDSTSHAEL
jgi:hypothetical protein